MKARERNCEAPAKRKLSYFYPEDESSMFLENVCIHASDYTVP
jgi:hypothetical protein